MLAIVAVIVCAVPVAIVSGMVAYLIFDVLVCDLARGFRDLYLERCDARLEEKVLAQNLLMPYVSWSDTVAHEAEC